MNTLPLFKLWLYRYIGILLLYELINPKTRRALYSAHNKIANCILPQIFLICGISFENKRQTSICGPLQVVKSLLIIKQKSRTRFFWILFSSYHPSYYSPSTLLVKIIFHFLLLDKYNSLVLIKQIHSFLFLFFALGKRQC
jgi:hypothetical protein